MLCDYDSMWSASKLKIEMIVHDWTENTSPYISFKVFQPYWVFSPTFYLYKTSCLDILPKPQVFAI